MTEKAIQIIESILAKGDRAEVLPGPNGTVKVIRIKRQVALNTDE